MAEIGSDLWESSSPKALLKQVPYSEEESAQEGVQSGLEYLQVRRLYILTRKPVPVLSNSQSKEGLPRVCMEFLMLQFLPVAPCPVTAHY